MKALWFGMLLAFNIMATLVVLLACGVYGVGILVADGLSSLAGRPRMPRRAGPLHMAADDEELYGDGPYRHE